MKLHNLLLTSTTALGLSMTAAIADDNNSFVEQTQTGAGTGTNTALINQSGSGNDAGAAATKMKQTASSNSNNDLDIIQSGNSNDIGLNGLSQISQYASSPNGNNALITQSSNNNVVGKVTQKNRFGGAVGATANTLTILQEIGDDNIITEVSQDKHKGGSGNSADITMSGTSNTISSAVQAVTGGALGNIMDVTISGNNNGRGALSGLAADSGATTSALKQGFKDVNNGNKAKGNNDLILVISGNSNQFGVTQQGTNNTVGTLAISGDSNQVGVSQDGNDNSVLLASIAVGSDANVIGISQEGSFNTASTSVDGDQNEFGIKQDGGANYGEINIIGDLNGVPGVGFSGDADSVLTGNPMMTSGLLQQFGDGNSVIVNVDGDSNSFATLQDNGVLGAATGNTINGTINGSSNQVAIAQVGGNNSTTFTQNGSFNNLGVTQ